MTPLPPLSTDTLHASTVARGGRAVLITGPSGAGKSDLSLRLLEHGFALVSDDRTIVRRDGETLLASAPAQIAGKMEVRGIGIVDMDFESDVAVGLMVELASDIERMPEDSRERQILGLAVPLVSIDAAMPSAAAKVALALDRLGLKP